MIVSHKNKYIFFHCQKNAGSSIREVLISYYRGERIRQHGSVDIALTILGRKKFDEYFKFAVVRNPYSRMVSFYNMLIHMADNLKSKEIIRPKSFEDFILNQTHIYKNWWDHSDELWRSQFRFLSDHQKIPMDYIIKYENLVNDYEHLPKDIFNKNIKLPHEKKWGVGNEWGKYYTMELREVVYKRHKKDFEEFGYGK